MASALKLVVCEIPKCMVTPRRPPVTPAALGPSTGGEEGRRTGGTRLPRDASDPRCCPSFLLPAWAHCQEKHRGLTFLSFSGEVMGLSPGCVMVSLFRYNGTVKSWCSWPRFGSGEVRDEALGSGFYSSTSESSEGTNPFVFAACTILLVMEVRVAVWKPKVLSNHTSGFGWHLPKKLVFSLVFTPIPHEQGGHRFDWKELIFFFLDTYLFLCITQIFFQI